MIPFKKINLGQSYKNIKPLFESGLIGLGNIVFEMEKELAKYVGAKEVVAVDSCTSALFLSLKYETLKNGVKKVSLPSMTVPLAANAAMETGCKLVFDTRCDWVGKYYDFIGSDVVDSAHELRRNQYKKMRATGRSANLKVCFSFYPTKTVGSADGGAIATDDPKFASWARSAATYGRNQGKKYQNSWDFDVEMIGYKRHYTNLQAAIVLEQLRRLDKTNAKRQAIVKKYNAAFGLKNDSDYLYRINVDKRDQFIKYAKERGVECGVHFKPLHLMTPYKNHPFSTKGLTEREAKKVVEEAYQKTVSLPLYDSITNTQVLKVIKVVKGFTL